MQAASLFALPYCDGCGNRPERQNGLALLRSIDWIFANTTAFFKQPEGTLDNRMIQTAAFAVAVSLVGISATIGH